MSTLAHINTLFSRRELLIAWIGRTIRARYKQSVLGGLWAVMQSGAATIVFSIVFTRFVSVNSDGIPYPVFIYSAMVPWTLFNAAISDMVNSLVTNMSLVKKIYFPREILPLAAMLARVLDAMIASLVVLLLIFLYRDSLTINFAVWPYLLLIIGIQMMVMTGLGLFGAALNVFYRDINHLYILGLQLLFYVTPIIYPATRVTESNGISDLLKQLYFLNPMAGIIDAYRAILLHGVAPQPTLLISFVIALILLITGYSFFKRVEPRFADVV